MWTTTGCLRWINANLPAHLIMAQTFRLMTMFRQLAFVGVAAALMAPDLALAKGGYVRPPPPQPMNATLAPASPSVAPPSEWPAGNCGPKRFLNARIHRCQGPGDWR
jgi:hypothetical protein